MFLHGLKNTRNTLLLPSQSKLLSDKENESLSHSNIQPLVYERPVKRMAALIKVDTRDLFFLQWFYLQHVTVSLAPIWWRDFLLLLCFSLHECDLHSTDLQPRLPTVFSQWQPFSWIKRGTHWFSHCLNLQLNPPDMSRMYCSVNRRHRRWQQAALMLTGEKGKKRMTRQRRGREASLVVRVVVSGSGFRFYIMPLENVCPLLTLTQMNYHKHNTSSNWATRRIKKTTLLFQRRKHTTLLCL